MPRGKCNLPRYQERHALQLLLTGEWKPARILHPAHALTLARMVAKGWVEPRKQQEIEYRVTESGREAFRQKLPLGGRRNDKQSQ